MTATFTTTQLVELHSKVWVASGSASAATYRILPNGKLNLIRIFDYNDVEVA